MSLLLGMAFACLGVIAITTIAVSLGCYVPFVRKLRFALGQPPRTEELRLTVREQKAAPIRTKRSPQRRKRPTKPVKRQRGGHTASSAVA